MSFRFLSCSFSYPSGRSVIILILKIQSLYAYFCAFFSFPSPFLNPSAPEFMQNLSPVGSGPSSNIWPRCPPHFLHSTSVLRIPWLISSFVSMLFFSAGAKKLGHPLPDSNFVSDMKSLLPQPAHT